MTIAVDRRKEDTVAGRGPNTTKTNTKSVLVDVDSKLNAIELASSSDATLNGHKNDSITDTLWPGQHTQLSVSRAM